MGKRQVVRAVLPTFPIPPSLLYCRFWHTDCSWSGLTLFLEQLFFEKQLEYRQQTVDLQAKTGRLTYRFDSFLLLR